MRLSFVLSLLASLATLSFGCAAPTAADDDGDDAPVAAESAATATGRVGTHGMVLFGSRAHTYLSHIPMFHAPHDVQAIVEIELPALAANMPPTFADRLYTFVPERFSLDALRTRQPRHAPRHDPPRQLRARRSSSTARPCRSASRGTGSARTPRSTTST